PGSTGFRCAAVVSLRSRCRRADRGMGLWTRGRFRRDDAGVRPAGRRPEWRVCSAGTLCGVCPGDYFEQQVFRRLRYFGTRVYRPRRSLGTPGARKGSRTGPKLLWSRVAEADVPTGILPVGPRAARLGELRSPQQEKFLLPRKRLLLRRTLGRREY